MADDYDIDLDDLLDMDDGWLYVEDEFALADELAEGQLANPGYSGTNHEIGMESYEFDLFEYWDDLEYADDSYWEYGLPEQTGQQAGQKRKRGSGKESNTDKRQKKTFERDLEPLIYRSRAERNRVFSRTPPRLENGVKFAFLPDWRQRFADEDGAMSTRKMPASMRRAAEGQDQNSPIQRSRLSEGSDADGKNLEAEEDWEDEEEEECIGDETKLDVDPETLKAILQEKLGAAGLDGLDEAAFMEAIQRIMSGDGESASGELANALLGKITSNAGDEAVSGWLSQQGVSFGEEEDNEEEEEGSSMTTGEESEILQDRVSQAQQNVTLQNRGQPQMPSHPGSAPLTSKKRTAPRDTTISKRQKKGNFDEVISPKKGPIRDDGKDGKSSDSKQALPPEQFKSITASTATATESVQNNGESSSNKRGRKRKAAADDTSDQKSIIKGMKSKELDSLGASPDGPFLAPPAKRTRSAKAKNGK